MAADFARLVSLACHDLRTPLATVQGFAKTLLRLDELEPEKQERYLGLIDAAADELVELLDVLSIAARLEGGRYEPTLQDADSLQLAPAGATGTGTTVRVDPAAVSQALAALARAAARHGGVEVAVAVDGARLTVEPLTPEAEPVVLGREQKDLGAAVAVRLLRALGGEVAAADGRLEISLPT